MKEWILFMMSIGFLLILLSTTILEGFEVMVSGIALVVLSAVLFFRKGKEK